MRTQSLLCFRSARHETCSVINISLKVSQNFKGNNCTKVSFYEDTPVQLFSCEFCEDSKNISVQFFWEFHRWKKEIRFQARVSKHETNKFINSFPLKIQDLDLFLNTFGSGSVPFIGPCLTGQNLSLRQFQQVARSFSLTERKSQLLSSRRLSRQTSLSLSLSL